MEISIHQGVGDWKVLDDENEYSERQSNSITVFLQLFDFFFCRPIDLSILVSFSTCAQEKVLRDHIR